MHKEAAEDGCSCAGVHCKNGVFALGKVVLGMSLVNEESNIPHGGIL